MEFPLEFGIGARGDGATRWSKKFLDRFSRFDNTGFDGRTDRRTDGRTRCRSKDPAYYVARVKTVSWTVW